ncbi:MAG: hypothetical protein LJE65_11055 [Desulfobacteraceae bacterium]|nr:hypothetical protein [Desulfobacteraceae bacterium]
MKAVTLTTAVGLTFALGLVGGFNRPVAQTSPQENHCFTCHTNPRKLIEITRDIARARPDKPGASTETQGEG